jgi:hypothetical protein
MGCMQMTLIKLRAILHATTYILFIDSGAHG